MTRRQQRVIEALFELDMALVCLDQYPLEREKLFEKDTSLTDKEAFTPVQGLLHRVDDRIHRVKREVK